MSATARRIEDSEIRNVNNTTDSPGSHKPLSLFPFNPSLRRCTKTTGEARLELRLVTMTASSSLHLGPKYVNVPAHI